MSVGSVCPESSSESSEAVTTFSGEGLSSGWPRSGPWTLCSELSLAKLGSCRHRFCGLSCWLCLVVLSLLMLFDIFDLFASLLHLQPTSLGDSSSGASETSMSDMAHGPDATFPKEAELAFPK